jgi:Na+-translocating ferredoxin:NAD+ oxidoreductase RnfG subunit
MIYRTLVFALLLLTGAATAQEAQKEIPVLHPVSNQQVVTSVYPTAVKVEKVNDYWYKVLDAQSSFLGFAMTSTEFCKDVKGYYDLTPVMIITDKDFEIKKVAILTHYETLGYVKRLEKKGFFNCWVGKSIKEAKTAKMDGYTGATVTAVAVKKNVDFLLKKGAGKLPKK